MRASRPTQNGKYFVMCPVSVEPVTNISRTARIRGGPCASASLPIHREPPATISHSDNCPEEDTRWNDSPLNSCSNRRGSQNRRRTEHHLALRQGRIEEKTVGEIEAAVCQGVSRFEQDYMGRGPREIHAHLLGDLLVVRLQGVLTAAEQHLATSLSADKGRDLLKQVRTHLIETARPVLEAMVQEVTGVAVLSLHHDISTVTGEKVVLFTLAESPDFREAKMK
jgi:uncharacterized protein YbcI